jgi:basic amino acid/polyamine antiporter, APA family
MRCVISEGNSIGLQSMLKGNLKRAFTLFDLIMVGIGLTIGSGIFYVGGIAQGTLTGSGTFLGYALLFIPVMFAALCFAEFSVEYPVAGTSFTYVLATLGEYPAALALGFLIINYVLAMGAVARALTSSFAILFNMTDNKFTVDTGSINLDFLAFAFILIITLVLCFGTKESSLLLAAANITGIFFAIFVGIAALTQADGAIFAEDFLFQGADGLFKSFAVLMFSYIGFDAVCNAIEEARDVNDVPIAIMVTVGTNFVLYVFMALALAFLVSVANLQTCVNQIANPVDCNSSGAQKAYTIAFVYGFNLNKMEWMQYIFAIGSCFTIVTTLIVGLYSGARILMVGAREWLLPPVLANISPRTQTPVIAQATIGVLSSILSLLTGFEKLSDLSSFVYLITLWLVCIAYLGRRYYPDIKLRYTQFGTVEAMPGRFQTQFDMKSFNIRPIRLKMTKNVHRVVVWIHLLLINFLSIACGISYRLAGGLTAVWLVIAWFVVTLSMLLICPIEYEPKSWKIHHLALPWVPSFAILAIGFVEANLQTFIYSYSLGFFVAVSLIYVFFSMPLSYVRRFSATYKDDDVREIELVYKNGRWLSVDQITTQTSYIGSQDSYPDSESPGTKSLPRSIMYNHMSLTRSYSHVSTERLDSVPRRDSSDGVNKYDTFVKQSRAKTELDTITDNSLQDIVSDIKDIDAEHTNKDADKHGHE